jgi:hypothetical protein
MAVEQEPVRAWVDFLHDQGWVIRRQASYDLCWLDCDNPGWLKQCQGQRICLCIAHAVLLEEGAWRGDYTGAPLPPDSRAQEWPWRPVTEAA